MKNEDLEISQDDPIVMYLIVNETLNMSIGKTAAQCAHASQMLTLEYFEKKESSKIIQKQMVPLLQPRPEGVEMDKLKERYAELSRPLSIFGEWLKVGIRKVVLKADNKEWAKIKVAYPEHILIIDAGLTEIASGSETCIGLWPMRKSQASKVIKNLQALK